MFESRKRHHPISQRKPLRRVALLALLFVPAAFWLASDWPRPMHRPVLGEDAIVTVKPVALDFDDATRTRVGDLTWLGGWEIDSPDPAFGSVSAMAIVEGGLLLLSDAGGVVQLTLDGGRPTSRARFGDLPDGPKSGVVKWHRDSEAMALDPRGRSAWVAFESENAIWRYASDLSKVQAKASPRAIRDWPINGGAEAMVRLGSRRFVLFAERLEPAPGSFAAVEFDRDPTDPAARATPFLHRPPSGSQTTDAAALPDGRVLLLHRRIGVRPFLSAKLTVIDPAAIRRDEIVTGEEIARFAPPLAVDNMEALAVGEEDGRTIVWIASDDNFGAPYQRTLLLKFALEAK